MSGGFLKHIAALVSQSDFIIEVLDARRPKETRNPNLEKHVLSKGKKLIFVINKADLVDKKTLEAQKEEIVKESGIKTIFVSALKKDGINMIRREAANARGKKENFSIGIVGYPNVGKSSLINALAGKGRGRVATSRKAGLTRGIAKVRISEGIYLIDSPGIIPYDEEEFDLFLVESKNPNQLKDIETNALKLIQHIGKEKIAEIFKINVEGKDEEEILDEIGKKKGLLKSGGRADTQQAARFLLEKYQKHELK
jgi:ribosome biogenesis GTPase A